MNHKKDLLSWWKKVDEITILYFHKGWENRKKKAQRWLIILWHW